jgi:hypothetical protein
VYPETEQCLAALEVGRQVKTEIRYYPTPAGSREYWMEDIRQKHVRMRQETLDEGFDYLFFVEADMIIPPDALRRLLEVKKDVAYGLYVSRRTGMWLCFPEINGFRGTALNANLEHAQAQWGRIVKSEGVGFGCTLVTRKVLEQVDFRRDNEKFADDWQFAIDVKAAGFESVHRLDVVCGHIVKSGLSIWPDPYQIPPVRYEGEIVKTEKRKMAIASDGRYRVLRPILRPDETIVPVGSIVEFEEEQARILLDKRIIESLEEELNNGTDD